MTPEYSVVVLHGIGAGKGEERRGFSGKLKQLVAKSCPDVDACWHEAPWEGVNDKVDSVVHSVVNELLDEYDTTAVVMARSAEIRQGCAWLHSIAVFITRRVKRVGRWMEKLRRALAPCLLWYARKAVPNLMDALIDLPLYLTRGKGNTIREEVRKCIAEVVDKTGKGVILVGHSLGSVIAFDVLAETIAEGTDNRIKALVTFGSPLGWVTRIRQSDETLFFPPSLPRSLLNVKWVNFYDSKDPVPLCKELDPAVFGGVENRKVDSGKKLLRAHCAYWSNAEIAECIAGLMRGEGIA